MPSLNLYRNISLTFIVFTVILLVAVFLFFTSKATIVIEPNPQSVNLSFNLEIKEEPTDIEIVEKDVVTGKLEIYNKSGSGEFTILSTKTVQSVIVGRIKIVNNNNRSQTLVKTTQLQADNGVIVRTNEGIVLPASGSVMVDVFAKDPNLFVNIEPGDLTIIKLNPSLQDKIYGVAEDVLTDGPREVKILAESDINRAKQELGEVLLGELNAEGKVAKGDNFVLSVKSYSTNIAIGEEANTFILEVEIELKILKVDEDQLANLIIRKVGNIDLSGLEIGKVDIGDIEYLIIDDNLAGSALVKVNYSLSASINEGNALLDRSNLVGRDFEEVKALLESQDLINSVEILSSPSWMNSLPKQESKIKIIIIE